MVVVRMALSALRKQPIRQRQANNIFARDTFALTMPMRKSVKRARALKRGGTAKIFIV
jgi:hypothetical protein